MRGEAEVSTVEMEDVDRKDVHANPIDIEKTRAELRVSVGPRREPVRPVNSVMSPSWHTRTADRGEQAQG